MAKIIEVKDLVKKYKKSKRDAVDNISFNVEEGEFFAFLGPNGAGKTTTISIITTLLSKTSGEVKVAGYDVEKQSQEVRSNIGIIFQNPSLDENLSAEENIRFHAVLYGVYPFRPTFGGMAKEYKEKVMSLAELLGIKQEMSKPVKTFSGGMKRKLEILRSLIHSPKILFLDEPTTGLDPASRRGLWEYLLEARKVQNTTIFLTTHYLEEAENVDRLAIIDEGNIVSMGAPAKIKQDLVDEHVIMAADSMEKLTTELKSKNIKFNKVDNYLKIDLEGDGKHAQELIKKVDTELNRLEIHIPSLEDAYLETIKKDTQEKEKHA